MGVLNIYLDSDPSKLTPNKYPKIYADPIISTGSLVLHDFSHPSGWDNGATLPTDGTLVPNIAWQQAANILGSGTRNSLSGTYVQTGLVGASSATHKLEFSGKKGLHSIVSQNPGLNSNEAMRLDINFAIASYIFANTPGRDFYFSLWRRPTRAQIIASSPQAFSAFCSSTSIGLFYIDPQQSVPNVNSVDKFSSGAANGVVPLFSNFRANPWFGTKPGSISPYRWLWLVGRYGAWNGTNATTVASQIFYRFYVEDLTTSGRTYAQVYAIDYALWQAAFASGGKFYNDTFTDPATIA